LFFGKQRKRDGQHTRRLGMESLEGRSLMASVAGGVTAQAAALVDDAYEQNDSRGAAKNLGTLRASKTVAGLVMADSYDWFRFSTTKRGVAGDSVAIDFLDAQGDLDLTLYNSTGRMLKWSDGVGDGEIISLSGMAAGVYYVRVNGVTNPAYSLRVNLVAPLIDDSYENNDSRTTARALGTLPAATTISNLVMADTHDWYRFSMSAAGTGTDSVSIGFLNSQGNLNLELYNASGTRLAVSSSTANGERISLAGRASGQYYVHVFGLGGARNPNYSLQIDPGEAAAEPPPPPPSSSSGFDIAFSFRGLTGAQQAIFEQAAVKWESIIVGDLPNATYQGRQVDDVLIDASAVFIDGVSGILGQAGPDALRSGSRLPYHGIMEFDSADVASMTSNGTLLSVILHEMGHVLGVGTIWDLKGLLTGEGTSNPRFTGAQAVAAYNSIFGTTATSVPVENTGGGGTRDSHWRESMFRTEIMTGWIGPGTNMPISRITVGSLADLGYTVNMATADAYVPPGTTSGAGGATTATGRGAIRASDDFEVEAVSLHQANRTWFGRLAERIQGGNRSQLENWLSSPDRDTREAAVDALLAEWSRFGPWWS
jgi:hypothetical protein